MAQRIPEELRLWVYARCVEDSTGRVLQLVRVCPGAFVFAHGCEQDPELRGKVAPVLLEAGYPCIRDWAASEAVAS